MRGIIDRIEGGKALFEAEDGKLSEILLELFDRLPREGDVVEFDGDRASVDDRETKRRREALQSRFDRMKKR